MSGFTVSHNFSVFWENIYKKNQIIVKKQIIDNSNVAWINKILSIQEQYIQGLVIVT